MARLELARVSHTEVPLFFLHCFRGFKKSTVWLEPGKRRQRRGALSWRRGPNRQPSACAPKTTPPSCGDCKTWPMIEGLTDFGCTERGSLPSDAQPVRAEPVNLLRHFPRSNEAFLTFCVCVWRGASVTWGTAMCRDFCFPCTIWDCSANPGQVWSRSFLPRWWPEQENVMPPTLTYVRRTFLTVTLVLNRRIF